MRSRSFWAAAIAAAGLVSRSTFAAAWAATGSGAWENTGNWQNGVVPSASGNFATFADSIGSASATVTLGQPETAAILSFEATEGGIYNLSGSTLTIDGGGSAAYLVIGNDNTSGDIISAPVVLNSNLTISAGQTPGAAPLVFSGGISGTGQLKTGAGPVVISAPDTDTAMTSLLGGPLTITPAGSLASTSVSVQFGSELNLLGSSSTNVQKIGALNVSAGSVVLGAGTAKTLLVTPSVLFGAAGSIDIGADDVDFTAENLAAVTGQAASGYDLAGGANWQGPVGITSSSATANTARLTAVGVIQNNQSGSPLFTAANKFDGTVPGTGDVLVRYTYFGDANLDGKVDGSDYSLIDAGYASHGSLTGWYHGDFNYDGVIDGSDYALIDNAFNNQGTPLVGSSSAILATATDQAAPAAVPEPGSLGLLLSAGLGIGFRRAKR